MTTAFAIILSSYLIGYFIALGIMLGRKDDIKVKDIIALCMAALISWIGIGLYLSGYYPETKKPTTHDQAK